jgi:ribonuclease-3
MREGELTCLRSALVRTETLADFGRQIDLGAAMRLGRGEVAGGGRQRIPLLCGTFEALVGAVYLDCGMDSVRSFVKPMLEAAVEDIQTSDTEQDPKSRLQEIVQGRGFGPPVYRTTGAHGPEHQKTFEVEVLVNGEALGRGRGHSKASAAKAAALDALKNLGEA